MLNDDEKEFIEERPVFTIFGEEEVEAVRRVLTSGVALTRGPDVDLFEQEFADYCGAKHAVALSSCGAALHIASKLLGLGPEDEVICQANAFWVTIVHLLERGVNIVCADIDPYSLNIDPTKIEALITSKTKAIYLVHHGGNPADLDAIYEIARKHDLKVVEDCAHAPGAEYKGKKIGYNSDIACFSFSTLKNMSTLGEGGMIVTNNQEYADMTVGLRTNFPFGAKVEREAPSLGEYHRPQSPAFMHAGDAWEYDWQEVEEFGSTYRMSTAQAAVGRIQLQKLDKHNEMRQKIADRYHRAIDELDGCSPLSIMPNCKNAWWIFNFFIHPETGINRDEFVQYLLDEFRVKIVLRFWPIHLGGIMRMRGHFQGECPVCEQIWFKEQMSLPMSPQMDDEEIDYIIKAFTATYHKLRT
jgi:perosamine synthetase